MWRLAEKPLPPSLLMCYHCHVAAPYLLKGVLNCPEFWHHWAAQFLAVIINENFSIIFVRAFGASRWRNILSSLNFCCLWCLLQSSYHMKDPSKLNFLLEIHVPSVCGLEGRKGAFSLSAGFLGYLASSELGRNFLWSMNWKVLCVFFWW